MNNNPLASISRFFGINSHISFISILNLSLALAVSFLLLAYVQNGSSYDTYNENKEKLYVLKQRHVMSGSEGYDTNQTPPALANYVHEQYPEVEASCLMIETWGDYIESASCRQFYEPDGFYADPNVFNLFTYEFITGNKLKALAEPQSIALSESLSQILFPDGNALGEVVTISKNQHLTVRGIYKDLPHNMHIRPSYLCTFDLYEATVVKNYRTSMGNQAFKTYVLLSDNVDLNTLNAKVNKVYSAFGIESKYQPYFSLVTNERKPGNRFLVYIASAVLLLLLSAFNYINSATIAFSKRIKEFGIRQVMGANRKDLIIRLLKESTFIGLLICLLAIMMVINLTPFFNQLINSIIELDVMLYWPLIAMVLFFLTVSLLAGLLIPVYRILSDTINPALKGQSQFFQRTSLFQRSLLVLQFIICVCFLAFSLVMQKQMQHISNKDIGLKPDNIVFSSPVYNGNNENWKDLLKENIEKHPAVKSVTVAMAIPFYGNSGEVIHLPNGMDQFSASRNWIDADYFKTFGIELIQGQNFKNDASSDADKCIVTQQTAKQLGLEEPVGQWIKVSRNKKEFQIIGVVKDHEHYSVYSQSPPMIYYSSVSNRGWTNKIAIALDDIGKRDEISTLTSELIPGLSFEYTDYTDTVAHVRGTYALSNSNALFKYFTLVALLVSLFGLYNIVTINTKARTKEIGIRKASGAKTLEVLFMLNKDVVRWVVLAFVLACPIAYYAMNEWLQNFAYQTELSWWLFALTGILTFMVALLTVSWQSIKAAQQNPIESLRYE